MLWAFAFSGGVGRGIDESAPDTAADWVWSHFSLTDNRSRLHIERLDNVPEAVRACLLGQERRPQTRTDGQWSFGVLPDFEHELGGSAEPGRLNFAFNNERLISTRRHALHVVDGLRRAVESGALRIAQPADAVALHVARFIDATEARLEKLGDQLDHAEDQLLADRADAETMRLGPIRRELSAYHREFVALRSAFHRASSHRNAAKSGPLVERLPGLVLEIEDFDRDLAGLQDRARLLHDELEARASAAANRSLRALTVLSTLLLPPTVLVGAFGMNVNGIPFADGPVGFWLASLLCAAVVVLCYWALRHTRILRD
jgi:zinc transporter